LQFSLLFGAVVSFIVISPLAHNMATACTAVHVGDKPSISIKLSADIHPRLREVIL